MPRYRRRRSREPHWTDLLVLVGVYIWVRTGSLVLGIGATLLMAFGPRLAIRAVREWRLNRSGLSEADRMSGESFERFLQVKLKRAGYRARLTPRAEDYGADLIVEKDGLKTVIQAKRYASRVGIEAVQQVIGAVGHYGADSGMVITNSYFTPNAKALARSNQVELWDRDRLLRFLLSLQKSGVPDDNGGERTPDEAPVCAKCGSPMVMRRGKWGQFFGCSRFPRCRFTREVGQ